MSGEILQLSSVEKPDTVEKAQPEPEVTTSTLAKLLHNKKLDAIWITLVVIFSASWTAWMLLHFQTSVDYKQSLLHQQYQLESDISSLKEKIQFLNTNETNRKTDYANSRVFSGYQEIAEWLYELAAKSKRIHLNVEYQLHEAIKDDRLDNIYIIPIELEVLAVRESNLSGAYSQFLDYMQKFLQQSIYLNLVSTSIENVNANTAKLFMKIHVKMWSDNLNEIKNNLELENTFFELEIDD